jgi:hypothetical protein
MSVRAAFVYYGRFMGRCRYPAVKKDSRGIRPTVSVSLKVCDYKGLKAEMPEKSL